jgi:hypothetical protein
MSNLFNRFHELFTYDNGMLIRNVDVSRIKKGSVASTIDGRYKRVCVDGKRYPEHQVIYMMHNGYFPEQIDHINGNGLDNRLCNLRPANNVTNGQNKKLMLSNKSGIKNVFWVSQAKKWRVAIRFNGKQKCIGQFKDLELAELVATMAREKYHGQYANHG